MEIGEPRWKGKGFAALAQDTPMSQVVKNLESSLKQAEASAHLSGCSALLQAGPEAADLLDRSCFGRRIWTAERDSSWFQLGPEEAFFLCHALRCLKILGQDGNPMNESEFWEHMRSRQEAFPALYKAYSHLRSKNWVVRPGVQYGVDFVAYRHHPALVHSEYAVLVLPEEGGGGGGGRLKVWSDLQGALRVAGSVAKALLVISIKNCCEGVDFPSCLEQWIIEERVLTRWVPEQCRDHS